MHSLFNQNYIFITSQKTQQAVFQEIYLKLLEHNLVKAEFLENLIHREAHYPTGIDLTVISSELPNIAIPHTESDYVNHTLLIPVKLQHPIEFKNMMHSEETLSVSFLFIILNKLKENQSTLLAHIMDFLSQVPAKKLNDFFSSHSPHDIYTFLQNHFISSNPH